MGEAISPKSHYAIIVKITASLTGMLFLCSGIVTPRSAWSANVASLNAVVASQTLSTFQNGQHDPFVYLAGKLDTSTLNEGQKAIITLLFEIDQKHLFEGWEASGVNEDKKKAFLEQAIALDTTYPGGLKSYYGNAKALAQKSMGKGDYYEGATISLPENIYDRSEITGELFDNEIDGLKAANRTVFVLVAGGVGDRLGYPGIKVGVPMDVSSYTTFLEFYCKQLKALQDSSNTRNEESRDIDFVIMLSEQTDKATRAILRRNDYFGLKKSQIHLVVQEPVPAVMSIDGKFAKSSPYAFATKPHGHGDIHMLLHTSGLAKKFVDNGAEHFVFFQDTNINAFNAIIPALGISAEEGLAMNSVAVRRKAGEKLGALADVKFPGDDATYLINMEYNKIVAIDKNDENGYSPLPGNVNVLVMHGKEYLEVLNETEGLVEEMVNVKKDKLKADGVTMQEGKEFRLETNMQDIALTFCRRGDKVAATSFNADTVFSTLKNEIEVAAKCAMLGTRTEAMPAAEHDRWWTYALWLNQIGKVDVTTDATESEMTNHGVVIKDVPEAVVLSDDFKGAIIRKYEKEKKVVYEVRHGLTHKKTPILDFSPDFMKRSADAYFKFRDCSISTRSALAINGKNVRFENCALDGALVVNFDEFASAEDMNVVIRNLAAANEGWERRYLTTSELAHLEKSLRTDKPERPEIYIRGYEIVENETVEFIVEDGARDGDEPLVFDFKGMHIKPGKYLLKNDGSIEALNFADELAEYGWKLETIIARHETGVFDIAHTAAALMKFSEEFNYLGEKISDEAQLKVFDQILIEKSKFARDLAVTFMDSIKKDKTDPRYKELVDGILQEGMGAIERFITKQLAAKRIEQKKADDVTNATKQLLPEWLDPVNNIPSFIVAGLIRGLLESRSEDILFCFTEWKAFGTAGIRNPAVQSSFGAIADLELNEFAGLEQGINGAHAPILTGPHLMNVITMLQQEQAIVNVYRQVRDVIALGDAAVQELIKELELDPRFVEDVKNNKVSIAYDSRLNGQYYARMLAAAFLHDGVSVDLFARPAGVPAVVRQASEFEKNRSAIAILISASHSEANANGFKAFISCQRSQVDKPGKSLIVEQRPEIVEKGLPYKMSLEFGEMSMEEFNSYFDQYRNQQGKVRIYWVGNKESLKDVKGLCDVDGFDKGFFARYYKHVKQLSPVKILSLSKDEQKAVNDARASLKCFYTAFNGCGAVNAQNFPGFLKACGYVDITFNDNQTLYHNGLFKAFNKPRGNFGMPDPGVPAGWIVNFVEFLQQEAGPTIDLDKLDKAIELFNSFNLGFATDPDIDRAGVMLPLDQGKRGGNIKEDLLQAVREKLYEMNVPADHSDAVIEKLKLKMNDQLLLTANDAWSFIVFHSLRMMHERNKLSKDKLYVLEKSHVTTDALESIAKYFRDTFGYNICVVNTYVGFTELAKKSRDLYAIARQAWVLNRLLSTLPDDNTDRESLFKAAQRAVDELARLNAILKSNVMYQNRDIKFVDATIESAQGFIEKNEGRYDSTELPAVMKKLEIMANLEIPMGVEESNGYGEFGVFSPNKKAEVSFRDIDNEGKVASAAKAAMIGAIEKEHISEKDGSLAAYKMAELVAVGKALEHKTAFKMYLEMFRAIGAVGTDNKFIVYNGLTGDVDKLNAMRWFETTMGVVFKKALDQKEKPTLFNKRYTVLDVQTYRDGKYDKFWKGFPEEGVRLILDRKGSLLFCTFRPSGTGANNRAYNWVFGAKTYQGKALEEMDYDELNNYRLNIVETLDELAMDFFGKQYVTKGYFNKEKGEFKGILSALGEVGPDQYAKMLGKFVDQPSIAAGLTPAEDSMRKVAEEFAVANKIGSKVTDISAVQTKNREAWGRFMASDDVKALLAKDVPTIDLVKDNSTIVSIPAAYVMGWQASAVDYLLSFIPDEGAGYEVSDTEVSDLVKAELKVNAKEKKHTRSALIAESFLTKA